MLTCARLFVITLTFLFLPYAHGSAPAVDFEMIMGGEMFGDRPADFLKLVEGYNSLAKTHGMTVIQPDTHLQAATEKFRNAGGLDYPSYVTHVQLLVSGSGEFSAIVHGGFSKEQVLNNLKASGLPHADGINSSEDMLYLVTDEAIVLSLSAEGVTWAASSFIKPKQDMWFRFRVTDQGLVRFGEKGPDMAEVVKELSIDWQKDDLQIRADFHNPATSAMVSGIVSGVIHGIRMAASAQETPALSFPHLSDLHSFASMDMVQWYLRNSLEKMAVHQVPGAVTVTVPGLGRPGFFFLYLLPVAVSVSFAEGQGSNLLSSGLGMLNGMEPQMGDEDSLDDPTCQTQLEQAVQALEFYNLDHGSRLSWEDAREQIFAEGYLPEDLSCNGESVLFSPRFVTGPKGQLMISPEE